MTTTAYGYKMIVSKETILKIHTKVGVDMALYGYCRVSTKTQKLERQIDNITKAYGEDVIIYAEKYTGTKVDGRKEFSLLMKRVKNGDTIIFDSVSRMSRNAEQGVKTYFELLDRGVELVFLKEPHINTSAYKAMKEKQIDIIANTESEAMNNLVDAIIDALNKYAAELLIEQIKIAFEQSEKEVTDLQVRVSEGMKQAKKRNPELQIGQKKGAKLNVAKKEPMKKQIRKLSKDFEGHNTDKEVMQITKLARNTYYKYKKELFQEIAEETD